MRPKLVGKLFPYFKKTICATLRAICRLKMRNLKIKKTQKLKKLSIILALIVITMVAHYQVSQVKPS